MLKKIVLLVFVFAFSQDLRAQIFKAYINEAGVLVDSADASHFTIISQVADTAWRMSLYSIDNIPIQVSTYSDTSFSVLHGDYVEYEKYYPSVRAEGEAEFVNFIKLRGRYLHGLRDGIWIEYYPTKNPMQISTFRFGALHGSFHEYYRRTNTIFAEGAFENSRREGEWKYFDENGKIIRTELYKRGRLQKKR